MPGARYVVGIDLGTTNCAVAYASLGETDPRVHSLPILQLVGEGECGERMTLPSFLYLGGPELPAGALALPWDAERPYAVGEFARRQGARVPGRLVSSAKSWLCHGGVDRKAPILPWGAAEEVPRLSPVEASARYLQHIREVWDQTFPDTPLPEQEVILTVPASFDEVARELTAEAASTAGLRNPILLEEPQAALYAWLQDREREAEQVLAGQRSILVVDVGGGTTDFSLVSVRWADGRLALDRVAVGDHILLGGDNMDLALARMIEERLGEVLDTPRFFTLVLACRAAKERLLSDPDTTSETLIVPGRGRSIVAATRSATVTREEVHQAILEGFFPIRSPEELPRREEAPALQEWGLPYASEPEITRHLAAFLSAHAVDEDGTRCWPDTVLFNGGALKPAILRARLHHILETWSARPLQELESTDLDLAVARGAAYYGLVRHGCGIRIGGGAARTYYLGLDPVAEQGPVRTVCLVERGMEEGEVRTIDSASFELVTNEAVQFPLFASSSRRGDSVGQILQIDRAELQALPPVRTILRFGRKLTARKLPVHLQVRLTEVGTLEIWCVSGSTDHRWRLQFDLRDVRLPTRGEALTSEEKPTALLVAAERVGRALAILRETFATEGPAQADPVRLVRALEDELGLGKEDWPLPVLRRLWEPLWETRAGRFRTPDHEARWYNLAGYLLRPGFGADLDALRVQHLWRLKSEGIRFARSVQVRVEWWNMWKRVAGGLDRAQQSVLWNEASPYLLPQAKSKARSLPRVGPQEIREFWQVLASCEHLAALQKAQLGESLLPLIAKGTATDAEIWALGRLGNRAPVYGPLNTVVARETVARWVEQLLSLKWPRTKTTAFAIAQLARCVADRERDLPRELRERVAERLRAEGFDRLSRLVLEPTPLESSERLQVFSESLPVGLVLREVHTASP